MAGSTGVASDEVSTGNGSDRVKPETKAPTFPRPGR
jgi:hypothetical protein